MDETHPASKYGARMLGITSIGYSEGRTANGLTYPEISFIVITYVNGKTAYNSELYANTRSVFL